MGREKVRLAGMFEGGAVAVVRRECGEVACGEHDELGVDGEVEEDLDGQESKRTAASE